MKKIFNHIKVIIIILIGVTILFSLLGAFRISTIENMDDLVPKCYTDVLTDDMDNESAGYTSYNENINNSKYILKTQIVPPKGTVCPMQISGPASNYLDSITKEPEIVDVEINESEDSTNSYNISIDDTRNSPDINKQDTTNEPDTQVPYDTSRQMLSDIKGSISQINQQKSQSDTCPPCPACERCPEPAFECKKVPNYRSPSIGQYLPMPILTDFSKF
jgi:hypothetical protein